MKYLLIAISFILCLNADVFEIKKDKNFSIEQIKEINKIYTLEGSVKKLFGLEEMFENETGDKNYRKYLQEAVQNLDWRKANYAFNDMIKEESYLVLEGKKVKVPTPEYNLALEYFRKAAEDGVILAGYQGLKILERYFMMYGANVITRQYQEFFSKKMMEQNYCPGYVYYARSISGQFVKETNYNLVKEILEKGREVCSQRESTKDFLRGINHDIARNNTLIMIKEHKAMQK